VGDCVRESVYRDRPVLMRAMFSIYLIVIVAGIAYFTIIGLTHH
jgi:hypothetical protein